MARQEQETGMKPGKVRQQKGFRPNRNSAKNDFRNKGRVEKRTPTRTGAGTGGRKNCWARRRRTDCQASRPARGRNWTGNGSRIGTLRGP